MIYTASRNEYEMLFKLSAQLGQNFDGTFSSAKKTLAATQKELQSLNKTQADISSYAKQQQSVDAINNKLNIYQQQLKNVQQELSEANGLNSSLSNKELDLQQRIEDTKRSLEQKTEALSRMRNALSDSGVDVENLSSESQRLNEEIESLKDKEEKAADEASRFGTEGANAFSAVGNALVAAGIAKGLQEIYQLYGDCVVGAAAYADEIGTVSVQYGIAAKDLQAYYYAAELVDVSVETLTSTMARNVRAMSYAQDGTARYVEAYEKLGVSVTNADGSLRDSEDVYWNVIDALGNMENASERDAVAMELLGRSAQQINTLIAAGSGVMNEYTQMAEKAGYIMNDKMLSSAMALDDELQIQKNNITALKNTVGNAYAPEMTNLLKIWNEMLADVTKFAEENPAIVKSLIAITAGAATFVGVYGSYVAIKKTSNALKVISEALTKKETIAQAELNATMMANPVGLIAAGVAALTVSVIALAGAIKSQSDETNKLTNTSQKQYDKIQELNAEYEETCRLYGESSDEARALHGELLLLEEDFEASKMTMEDFNKQVENSISSYEDFVASHEASINAINNEEDVVLALVSRLERLESQTSKTEAEKEQMLALVNQLNDRLPTLGLSYDKVTGALNSTSEAIRNVVEAEIARKKYEQNYEDYYRAVEQELEFEKELAIAKANTATAQEKYNELLNSSTNKKLQEEINPNMTPGEVRWINAKYGAFIESLNSARAEIKRAELDQSELQKQYDDSVRKENEMLEAMGLYSKSMQQSEKDTEETIESTKEFRNALDAVRNGYLTVEAAAKGYGVNSEILQKSVDKIEKFKNNLTKAINAVASGYYSATEAAKIYEVTVEAIDTVGKIQDTIDKISELGESYHEIKNSAEQSIQGQYELWDTAAIVIPADIGKINTSLETQLAYWSDYNTDLTALLARANDIEGLSDLIASFADGSTDSVNAIAGMANASDEDLRKMVGGWQEVRKQQEETANSIAEIATGFTTELGNVKDNLETAVDSLNLEDEAEVAAKATMDAYIQALRTGSDEATKIAEQLALQIGLALNSNGAVESSGNNKWSSYQDAAASGYSNIMTQQEWKRRANSKYENYQEYLDDMYSKYIGYANGTDSAIPGLHWVGENGPELMAFKGGEKVYTSIESQRISALPLEAKSNHGNANYTFNISPNFNLTGVENDNMSDKLEECGNALVDMVIEKLEDIAMDSRRNTYV